MLTAETVDQIVRFDADGLPVTSVYARVDIDPGRDDDLHTRVSSLLDEIRPLAKDTSVEHEVRLSVRADIERIRESLAEERWPPGAMAIFACSGRGLYEEVSLPRAVRDQVVLDATSYVRPMLTVLDEYHRTCVVVVDKASARLFEFYQDELRELREVRDEKLRRPDYGAGLASDTMRNRADEVSKRHYRNVAHVLRELFQSEILDLLVVGGHDYEVPAFINYLPHDLRGRIAGTFTIDPSADSAAEVRKHAAVVLRRYEQAEEHKLLDETFERLATGELAAAGLDGCLWAGSVAGVQTLLALEGVMVPGVVCDKSGWLARSGDYCPLCGNPTRPTPDVIGELAQEVITEGGSVKNIEADDRLAELAVAASLRFPLPPGPTAAA